MREQLRIDQRDALLEAAFFPTASLDYRSLDTASRQLNDLLALSDAAVCMITAASKLAPTHRQTPSILIQGGEQYGDQFELEALFRSDANAISTLTPTYD